MKKNYITTKKSIIMGTEKIKGEWRPCQQKAIDVLYKGKVIPTVDENYQQNGHLWCGDNRSAIIFAKEAKKFVNSVKGYNNPFYKIVYNDYTDKFEFLLIQK